MSVQVTLYVIDEEIDDRVLGVIAGGAMAQLTSNVSLDEEMEAYEKMDNCVVGSSKQEYARRVQSVVEGREQVDDGLIETIEALASVDDGESRCRPEKVVDFLEENRGEEVVTVGV